MIKVVIVEDEPLAAQRLAKLIVRVDPHLHIVGMTDSVAETIQWLKCHDKPDLLFLDVQLGDGLSFEIFEQVNVDVPIIFTTAFDQYAVRAFRFNSVDYLLKPIEEVELEMAIARYRKRIFDCNGGVLQKEVVENIKAAINGGVYKERFVVRVGTHIKMVGVDDILFFYSFQKGTFFRTREGQSYLVEQSLEGIEEIVDPKKFFRISRKYIVGINGIKDIVSISSSRLKLKMINQKEVDMVVSRERVKTFKDWLEGGG